MSNLENKPAKGRLHWLVPVLEIVVVILYLAIGFGGIMDAVQSMDFAGIFESVIGAMIFLTVAIVAITIMCFIPIFKSRANIWCAIWNIIWLCSIIYGII